MQRFPTRTLILLLLVTSAILIPFFIWEAPVAAWFDARMDAAAGYPLASAAVLFSLLASDIILPVPSSLVSTSCGLILGLWTGFFVSFMAMNVSAVLGYGLGRFFSRFAAKLIGPAEQAMLVRYAQQNGRWLLLLFRPVPVLAEASVVFSGLAHQPVRRAAVEVLAGNAIVSFVYAAVGAYGRASDSMLPACLATLVISGLCMLAVRFRR